jgi:hypothetical protein
LPTKTLKYVQPRDSFTGDLDGEEVIFNPKDILLESHPAVRKWPQHFKPLEASRPEIEEMTDEPGKKRGE